MFLHFFVVNIQKTSTYPMLASCQSITPHLLALQQMTANLHRFWQERAWTDSFFDNRLPGEVYRLILPEYTRWRFLLACARVPKVQRAEQSRNLNLGGWRVTKVEESLRKC